jgi:hypothetical protein
MHTSVCSVHVLLQVSFIHLCLGLCPAESHEPAQQDESRSYKPKQVLFASFSTVLWDRCKIRLIFIIIFSLCSLLIVDSYNVKLENIILYHRYLSYHAGPVFLFFLKKVLYVALLRYWSVCVVMDNLTCFISVAILKNPHISCSTY